MAAADLAPIWADLEVHPWRPETHRDLRACTSELHRSREALSRARGRAPIWGRPQRSTETAPIWGHTCWNPPIWGVAPIWGHSSESAPIWEKSLKKIAPTAATAKTRLSDSRSAARLGSPSPNATPGALPTRVKADYYWAESGQSLGRDAHSAAVGPRIQKNG